MLYLMNKVVRMSVVKEMFLLTAFVGWIFLTSLHCAEADLNTLVLGSEIITNGDNESALATFYADAKLGCTVAQSIDQAHSGSSSAKITKSGGGDALWDLKDTDGSDVTPGKLYKVSLWGYLPSGQTTSRIRLRLDDGGGGYDWISITATGVWTEATGYVTVGDSEDLRIQIMNDTGSATEYFYIDDISLKEVTDVGTEHRGLW